MVGNQNLFQPLTIEPPVHDVDLFRLALGLETPWRVERSEFDAEGNRLDLCIDFQPGKTFVCPECGGRECKAHDASDKTGCHLSLFQHETYLHACTPRVRCERCGVKLVEVLRRSKHFWAGGTKMSALVAAEKGLHEEQVRIPST